MAAMMVGAIGAVRNSANTLTAASDAVDIAGYRRYVEKVTAEEDAKMDRILQSQSVREMGSGMNTHKATRPTFFMHGIMDNDGAGNTLKGCFAGDQFWYNLPIYNDKASLTNINKQVAKMKELIKEKVKKDPSTFANGYNLICHSQGGVVCRTLITTWNDHNVKTFVSLAGPVQGVQGYGTYLDFMPKWASDILSNNVVNTLAAQKKISCANYFHDRSSAAAQKDFRRWSEVLARINNEVPAKYCHRESLRKGCQPSSLGCKWRFSEGACTYEGDESGFNKTKQYQKNFMKLDHAVFMGARICQTTHAVRCAPVDGPRGDVSGSRLHAHRLVCRRGHQAVGVHAVRILQAGLRRQLCVQGHGEVARFVPRQTEPRAAEGHGSRREAHHPQREQHQAHQLGVWQVPVLYIANWALGPPPLKSTRLSDEHAAERGLSVRSRCARRCGLHVAWARLCLRRRALRIAKKARRCERNRSSGARVVGGGTRSDCARTKCVVDLTGSGFLEHTL